MAYIPRNLESTLAKRLFQGKALLLYGPRQCGKTTMIRHITEKWADDVLWLELQWRPIAGRWISPEVEPKAEELIETSLAIEGSEKTDSRMQTSFPVWRLERQRNGRRSISTRE